VRLRYHEAQAEQFERRTFESVSRDARYSMFIAEIDIETYPIRSTLSHQLLSGNDRKCKIVPVACKVAGLEVIAIDRHNPVRSFIRYADGTFSEPIVEPSDTGNFTVAKNIDNLGRICGYYFDGFDPYHPYRARGWRNGVF
jgi:hypothetical protein